MEKGRRLTSGGAAHLLTSGVNEHFNQFLGVKQRPLISLLLRPGRGAVSHRPTPLRVDRQVARWKTTGGTPAWARGSGVGADEGGRPIVARRHFSHLACHFEGPSSPQASGILSSHVSSYFFLQVSFFTENTALECQVSKKNLTAT